MVSHISFLLSGRFTKVSGNVKIDTAVLFFSPLDGVGELMYEKSSKDLLELKNINQHIFFLSEVHCVCLRTQFPMSNILVKQLPSAKTGENYKLNDTSLEQGTKLNCINHN